MAPEIRIDPAITPDQLHAFYQRNQICEAAYSQARAAVVLGALAWSSRRSTATHWSASCAS